VLELASLVLNFFIRVACVVMHTCAIACRVGRMLLGHLAVEVSKGFVNFMLDRSAPSCSPLLLLAASGTRMRKESESGNVA
jgi:hypothetical protein